MAASFDPKLVAAGALSAAAAAYACGLGSAEPAPALPVESGSLVLYVNGVQTTVPPHELHPRMTLLEFLRENLGLTGAKISCNQGGCGACTVMLTSWDAEGKAWEHRAVNGCLRPVLSCHGMAITTAEGIGTRDTGFHPVQERIAACNGSQCGFCTPGQVMSLYSLLREKGDEPLSLESIEERFDGNICRCTGYRPIMTAAHTFAREGQAADRTDISNFSTKFEPYVASSEKPPPASLTQGVPGPLSVVTPDATWLKVSSIAELNATRAAAAAAGKSMALVVGNTKTGPYGKDNTTDVFIDISALPELNARSASAKEGVTVGAAVTITKLMTYLTENASLSPGSYEPLVKHMKRVGNWQVRNVGSWAGNLTMAKTLKFASDLSTIFMGAGATLSVLYKGVESTMSIYDYLWEEHDMDQMLVLSITIPTLQPNEIFQTYRAAIRQNSAHALLNAAFRVTLTDGVITDATLVYGLAQDRAVFATQAEDALKGKALDVAALSTVLDALDGFELIVESHYKTVYQPEGKESYRRSLVQSFMYKFFLHLMGDKAPASLASAAKIYERGVSSGKQTFKTVLPPDHSGSKPMPKIESKEQAAGETIYHDDEGIGNCLHAAFVPCTQAPAIIVSIDTTEALSMPGVVAFVGAEDIAGNNSVAFAAPGQEELFVAVGEKGAGTSYVGQPLGCIVAKTRREAEAAIESVKVTYAADPNKPGLYSLEDAIAAKSYQPGWEEPRTQAKGDVKAAIEAAKKDVSGSVVVTGEFKIGGQSHFAMEKNTCLSLPIDNGRFELHHSTQMPDGARGFIANAAGVTEEKIQIICRRLGGGFGGKATKNIPIGMAATLCAKKLRKPVKLANSIGQDMMMYGNARHPMIAKYTIAAEKKTGKITAMDVTTYVDAGCSADFSDFIAGEMLENIESVYITPNYSSTVYLLRTNTASNTAVRAPGLLQAAAVSETMLDELAATISMDKEEIRLRNMMTEQQCTPNVKGEGTAIADYNLPRIWSELEGNAQIAARKAQVDSFNQANRWKKRGIAMSPLRYGFGHGHVAGSNVTINVHASDGTVEVFHTGHEMGQGLTTKLALTISMKLNIPMEMIYVHGTNTSVIPNDTVSGGSTTSEAVCRAGELACEELLQRLSPFTAEGATEGSAGEEDPEAAAKAKWVAACKKAWGDGGGSESLSVNRKYSTKDSKINPEGYFGLGAAVTEVEVDILTGQVSVLRADLLYDCGHSLSPLIDIGQAEGAYVMGLGFFLQEETMYSDQGELVSDGTWEYKPPLYNDIPEELNIELLKDSPYPRGVRSSKAVGEPPLLLAVTALGATRAAIRASRLERGRREPFTLNIPCTIDRVQQAADVTKDEMVLKVVREFVPS